MQGTNDARDRRRAERWVDRSGGISYLPPEAFDLLIRRLAARHRAAVQCTPYYVIAACFVVSVGFGPSLGTDGFGRAFATRALLAYAALAIGSVRFDRLAGRADQQIAHALPHRVSRGTAVSIPTILGRTRTGFLVIAIAVDVSLAIALLLVRDGWLAWTYLLALATTCGFVAQRSHLAAVRATVALDPSSLAIDERMRSEDVYRATGLLFLLLYAFPAETVGGDGSHWLLGVWGVAGIGLQTLWILGVISRPWRPRWSWPHWFTTPPPSAGLS